MKILVVAETDGAKVRQASLSALSFARQIGGEVELLLIGSGIGYAAENGAKYAHTCIADHEELGKPLADRYATVIEARAREIGAAYVVATATGWAKDIVGRAAGLLGGAMVSDIVGHEGEGDGIVFKRPMFAGELMARVALKGLVKIVTVRSSFYPAAELLDEPGSIQQMNLSGIGFLGLSEYIDSESKPSNRPDASEARIVVSGGRAFKTPEDYECKVGALADRIGGAVGASRALVDAGLVSNELQIGQTGKIVAPDLYLALGLSGAIQHLAGMSHSRVIAAVNKDPDAPIFSVADYGLVGDVHLLVPELIAKLGR